MKRIKNFNIASKLIVGFIIIALIAGIMGTYGIYQINNINDNYTKMYEVNTKPLSSLTNIGMQFMTIQVELKDASTFSYMFSANRIKNSYQVIDTEIAEIQNQISDDNIQKNFNRFVELYDKMKPFIQDIMDNLKEGNNSEADLILLIKVEPIVSEMTLLINAIILGEIKEASNIAELNAAKAFDSKYTMLIIVTFAFVLSVILGIIISKSISKPINKMVEASNKLAMGDIDVKVQAKTKDEVGKLAESFNKMIENIRKQALAAEKLADGDLTISIDVNSENDLLGKKLNELIDKNNVLLYNINVAATQLAVSAKQISESNSALAQGATEQASSIEELTASLEEIAVQTNMNAENAELANELAEISMKNAEQGNNQMIEMLNAMQEINESSEKIHKIIKVIDDIAFQTNMLALNAAVEAARAGEHGKGFAVVADEVRNLAARSAEAAKETSEMIGHSIKKIQGGTQIANETANALMKIVNGITKAGSYVSKIAVSSKEQAIGITQINQSITEVSQVVSTNSATAEQGAAASEELSGQAEMLKGTVSKFKLKKISHNKNKQILSDIDEVEYCDSLKDFTNDDDSFNELIDTLYDEDIDEFLDYQDIDEGLCNDDETENSPDIDTENSTISPDDYIVEEEKEEPTNDDEFSKNQN